MNLPFGDGFAFSRLWFQKYHNNKGKTVCDVETLLPSKGMDPKGGRYKTQVTVTGRRSQVIVLPTLKQSKPLPNVNLNLTLGLNILLRLKVSI